MTGEEVGQFFKDLKVIIEGVKVKNHERDKMSLEDFCLKLKDSIEFLNSLCQEEPAISNTSNMLIKSTVGYVILFHDYFTYSYSPFHYYINTISWFCSLIA